MSAADELRKALPYADAWGAASRSLAFRRIAELLVRARGTDDAELRETALATLGRLRATVSPAARLDAARLAERHWPDARLLALLGNEGSEQPRGADIEPEPPAAPTGPAVEDGARSIDRLATRVRPPAEPDDLAALAGDWRWECDARGRFTLVDGTSPLALAPALFELEGADAIWPAFARQAPFRGAAVLIDESRWTIAGVPFFDRATGNFLGYRGTAERLPGGVLGAAASAESLAKTAHEVRSPLNAIMGFAQMIESETLGPAPEAERQRAVAILDNAQRLLGALDDLTDAARLDRGQWPVAPERVDTIALILRTAERYRAVASARDVAIAATAPPTVPPVVADPRSLERTLKRLVAAALAVAEPGETLLLGAQRAGADVRLYLSRPAALDELSPAELYATANADREGATAPLLGLGFGLRLVDQLVEAMGGRFMIEPQRFALTLPAGQVDEQAVANGG